MTERLWRIPLSDLAVDEELLSAARDVLASGWWSMGPRVAELEGRFAEAFGSGHAVAVSSGTASLHLALLAVGCGPGDEVVLPSLTFVAAANVVAQTGATPVFCDVRGATDLNLDPDDLDAAVGPRCRAVIVLHYGGFACDMDAVTEIAARRGVAVIEDAAHAPGASWQGRPCGTIGDIGCFSFFSNKNLPVGEGGMVVTSDDALAERIRLARSHGMTTLTWQRHKGHASSYDVVVAGLNYRLDEVRAALATVQLARLTEANAARRRLVALYRGELEGVEGLVVPFAAMEPAASAHHLMVVVLPAGAERDAVRTTLRGLGIQTSVHYPPIHRFTFYREVGSRALPRTEELADRLLTLPLYPHLRDDEVEEVCTALRGAVHDVARARV